MIKSITFTGKFGYINETIPEPDCSVRGYGCGWKRFTDEEKKLIAEYEKEYKYWEDNQKGKYMYPEMVKNLIGRKIGFESGKINLIFGPNASGKTTILKALAGVGGTTDGYAKLLGPIEIRTSYSSSDITREDMDKNIEYLMQNSADVEWDGAPIYYDNFSNRKTYGYFGDLGGSVLGNDIMTEMTYIMGKNKISLGQNSIYLMKRLFSMAQEKLCYADIFSKYLTKDGKFKKSNQVDVNGVWYDAYKVQMKYFLEKEKGFVKSPVTFLFDEIDKSLDIANIYSLYTDVLPSLVKETGVQVVIISHSPLVLSDKIRNNEMYNFISIDEGYTESCLENLKKLF